MLNKIGKCIDENVPWKIFKWKSRQREDCSSDSCDIYGSPYLSDEYFQDNDSRLFVLQRPDGSLVPNEESMWYSKEHIRLRCRKQKPKRMNELNTKMYEIVPIMEESKPEMYVPEPKMHEPKMEMNVESSASIVGKFQITSVQNLPRPVRKEKRSTAVKYQPTSVEKLKPTREKKVRKELGIRVVT